jgi:phenylacetate-CoA ligase
MGELLFEMQMKQWLPNLNPWSRVTGDFREAARYWDEYERTDLSALPSRQLESFKAIWRDCTRDVPYYRNLVSIGAAPSEVANWEDFRKIPFLTREILQEKSHEFRRLSGGPDATRMTGGSTAQPVSIGVWNSEALPQRVVKLVLWMRAGYQSRDRLFLIWGHLHLLGTGWRRWINHGMRRIKDRLLNYQRIDAYCLTPEKCDRIARELLRFRPAGLIGYAAALDYFVRATEKHHDAFRNAGLKFVMPASEVPPHPDTFQLLESVFRCPVVQEFAGVEFGQVAMKFGEQPFQTFHDLNYVETVAPEVPGACAEPVVLTSLFQRYMPLIRYRQGDAISGVKRLSNGHVTMFDKLEGRTHDVVEVGKGEMIHSMAILHCIHQEKKVLNIQLVVRDSGPILRLAVLEPLDDQTLGRIRARLAQVTRHLARAVIEQVADLETTRAGKRRWIIDERTTKSVTTEVIIQP